MYNKVVLDDFDHRVVFSSSVTIYFPFSSVDGVLWNGTMITSICFHNVAEQISDSNDLKCLLNDSIEVYLITINNQRISEEFTKEGKKKKKVG